MSNIFGVEHKVTPEIRAAHNHHQGGVLWLTGLSGSGKSTLAMELEKKLVCAGYRCYVLDGDNLRNGLNRDLHFSMEDRAENVRRVGEVAALFADAGLLCIVSLISPRSAYRNLARKAAEPFAFHEVYLDASVEDCAARDPKGLYAKAEAGHILRFTGVDSPYESPTTPELILHTARELPAESLARLLRYVLEQFPYVGHSARM